RLAQVGDALEGALDALVLLLLVVALQEFRPARRSSWAWRGPCNASRASPSPKDAIEVSCEACRSFLGVLLRDLGAIEMTTELSAPNQLERICPEDCNVGAHIYP